jgi:hypothetical protein
MTLLKEEIERKGGLHSKDNTPVEEIFDMILDGMILPVWHVDKAYCEWTMTKKWNKRKNGRLVSKRVSAMINACDIEKSESVREAAIAWMNIGLVIIDENGDMQQNTKDYPELVKVINKICEEKEKEKENERKQG